MAASPTRSPGRPSVTDHAAIERAAFALFQEQGFDDTTMDHIARAVGVGKRTLFRYFPSKNDIPWGQFDQSLAHFSRQFDAVPPTTPLADAVHGCVVAFNTFDESARDQHRFRMRLILQTPALQAHSAIKYEAWRRVIAEYVARRLSLSAGDHLPRLVGHVSLAVSVAAYEQWLDEPASSVTDLLDEQLTALRTYLA
ncbi:mycofactocin system transcriptional regulator [Aeromicrobium fastidiosum]|uniref:Mycofactocin system transcriptional regulator n=1 Tax=Aeromicrobium fastidiosum TaxID=52699 RepID=A0A641AQZ5_9ACTN|nr:mycofactocin system transcriptional regulator [Aeromicrobium fastidiosum]KAA1379937.1 mycofactocin system transcriptional regulator [Aeromicrobium fastidiosum]MBP2389444.1 mycofactocin system transcriptional regulator [Aeromicrobium fastidiosum]